MMTKQNLKPIQAALARAGYAFTGYDWTGSGRSAAPVERTEYLLDPVARARAAQRAWKRQQIEAQRVRKQQATDARRAAADRRSMDAIRERVAVWAHARVPGDPCIGQGC